MVGKFGRFRSRNGATAQARDDVRVRHQLAADQRGQEAGHVGESVRASEHAVHGVTCLECHGADAGGFTGFPNLRDADWLWGGTPEAIKHSIGLGRQGAMPGRSVARTVSVPRGSGS